MDFETKTKEDVDASNAKKWEMKNPNDDVARNHCVLKTSREHLDVDVVDLDEG